MCSRYFLINAVKTAEKLQTLKIVEKMYYNIDTLLVIFLHKLRLLRTKKYPPSWLGYFLVYNVRERYI